MFFDKNEKNEKKNELMLAYLMAVGSFYNI
jgi:hypothetical protein